VADVKNTKVVEYPSSDIVRLLNIVAAVLTVLSIIVQTLVPILQQMGKRKPEREGLETAMLLTIVGIVARSVPTLVREIKNLRQQMAS
jgi:hypothetical protein